MEEIVKMQVHLGVPALDLENEKIYFGRFRLSGKGQMWRSGLDGKNRKVVFRNVSGAQAFSVAKVYS